MLINLIKKLGSSRAGLTRVAALALVVLAVGAASAQATPISGLFNTGVDGSGNALGPNVTDPHYALISSDDSAFPIPVAKTVITLPGTWPANPTTPPAAWISANPVETGESSGQVGLKPGTYIYRLTFTLAANQNPALASITGDWAADNVSLIYLNGVYVPGLTNLTGLGGSPSLLPFNIPSAGGGTFVTGENHLDFVVVNSDLGPSGLLVANIQGNAPLIPEPSTVVLSLVGGVGLMVAAWRRRRSV